jgi:hypothetical protein
MVDKSFEITVKFQQVFGGHWYPIVQTIFLRSDGTRIRLPLLFDTGADSLVLHPDYEIMFSSLQPQKYKGIGSAGTYDGKKTMGKIEIFGRVIECEIGFVAMEFLPWRAGLLGRNCFSSFGFGFWEAARELYVNLKP